VKAPVPRYQFGKLFSLELEEPGRPLPDTPSLEPFLEDPDVGAALRGRRFSVIGVLNEQHPVFVDQVAPQGAVFAVSMIGGAYRFDQIADARAGLEGVSELIALAWEGHAEAFALPFTEALRTLVNDVLLEIARGHPGSSVDFWRFHFFRQFDLHLRV
jgi:hypothetical protein